jgi:hypothetical protein
VEASKFVDFSRKPRLLGFIFSPALQSLVLKSLVLQSLVLMFAVAAPVAQAQSGTTQNPPAQAPAPQAQPAPATPAQTPVQTPEERARVIRDAQARVNARRGARIAQVIRETYGYKFEGYVGGGYLRFRPGDNLQHNNEAAWNAGVTDFIKPNLGVTVDVRGYYGTPYVGNNIYGIFLPSISQYSFLFGPQYRVYAKPKLAVSVQGLVGFGHGNFDTGTGGLPGYYLGLYPNGTAFSFSLGAPVDYNLSPSLAVRITPTYVFTNYGSSVQNNLGFNAGVVYRWGKH